jgi:hypothetical protein
MALTPTLRARRRPIYFVATAAVIGAGLASRRFPGLVPDFLAKYPGDSLWALMVFLGLGMLLTRISTRALATLALATCTAVEFSQLYSAPWIDELRSTTLGALALGSGFNWRDLVAYAVGIAIGAVGESAARLVDFSAFDRR